MATVAAERTPVRSAKRSLAGSRAAVRLELLHPRRQHGGHDRLACVVPTRRALGLQPPEGSGIAAHYPAVSPDELARASAIVARRCKTWQPSAQLERKYPRW